MSWSFDQHGVSVAGWDDYLLHDLILLTDRMLYLSLVGFILSVASIASG